MICVLIISPIPALRAGLRALVSGDSDIQVAGAAASLVGLTEFPAEEGVLVVTPDVLDEHAFEQLSHQDNWAVLLVGDDPAAALALARGLPQGRAWGMLSSDTGSEALHAALSSLSEGLSVASSGVMAQIIARLPLETGGASGGEDGLAPENLTERETAVLRLAAQGLTNKQIALALKISEHTVKFHVSSIYAKLGVSNRAEAVSKGARWGLVPL